MSNPEIYSVGWICALPKELVAARLFLDEVHPGPDCVKQHDNNCYTLGRIGKHNVVIASLPMGEYGTVSAASVARDMLHTFPNIRTGLMVGIGGGAPSEKNDIRLGDVVVSLSYAGNNGGVYQYDYASTIEKHELQKVGHLDAPPYHFGTAMANLESRYASGNEIAVSITDILKKSNLTKKYGRPSSKTDRLYQSDYVHLKQDDHCDASCDKSKLVVRQKRKRGGYPTVHHGIIASANCLMMDAELRDKFAKEENVLCFEMEAAGLMNHFPCIVIRGICDYSDSHKNYDWQEYAAMTAAAYTKELLLLIPQNDVEKERIAVNRESEQVESTQKVGERDESSELLFEQCEYIPNALSASTTSVAEAGLSSESRTTNRQEEPPRQREYSTLQGDQNCPTPRAEPCHPSPPPPYQEAPEQKVTQIERPNDYRAGGIS